MKTRGASIATAIDSPGISSSAPTTVNVVWPSFTWPPTFTPNCSSNVCSTTATLPPARSLATASVGEVTKSP